jgi:hypothetical protein
MPSDKRKPILWQKAGEYPASCEILAERTLDFFLLLGYAFATLILAGGADNFRTSNVNWFGVKQSSTAQALKV